MDEVKPVNFKIEGDYLIIGFDPNKDGKNVAEFKVHLLEIVNEIASVIKN